MDENLVAFIVIAGHSIKIKLVESKFYVCLFIQLGQVVLLNTVNSVVQQCVVGG